jgi:hypothetical protein
MYVLSPYLPPSLPPPVPPSLRPSVSPPAPLVPPPRSPHPSVHPPPPPSLRPCVPASLPAEEKGHPGASVQAAASGSCAATRTPSRVSRRSSSSASAPASSASLPRRVVHHRTVRELFSAPFLRHGSMILPFLFSQPWVQPVVSVGIAR